MKKRFLKKGGTKRKKVGKGKGEKEEDAEDDINSDRYWKLSKEPLAAQRKLDIESNDANKKRKCALCPLKFKQKFHYSSYAKHRRVFHDRIGVVCPNCDQCFASTYYYNGHSCERT